MARKQQTEVKTHKKSSKLTWDEIYKDFRRRHPNLSKRIFGFRPYGYATIIMRDYDVGQDLIYNYDEHRAYYI